MRGLVSRLIVIFLCTAVIEAEESTSNTTAPSTVDYNAVADDDDDYRCGWQVGGKKCTDKRCCSQYGYCGSTLHYCSDIDHCQSFCWTGEGVASDVIAYYHHYEAEKNDWNLTAAGAACALSFADKPYSWRRKFNWTAFCGPVGPQGWAACGKCVRVENMEKNEGASVLETLRIVDGCKTKGFVLDADVFNRLDFNGNGHKKGHIFLDYHFVDCEDDDDDDDDDGGSGGDDDDNNVNRAFFSNI